MSTISPSLGWLVTPVFRLSQTVLTATPPKKSQAWTWHMSHVFCLMSSVASTYLYCEYGSVATNRWHFVTSPVAGSVSHIGVPFQSTSMTWPGLCSRWLVTPRAATQDL